MTPNLSISAVYLELEMGDLTTETKTIWAPAIKTYIGSPSSSSDTDGIHITVYWSRSSMLKLKYLVDSLLSRNPSQKHQDQFFFVIILGGGGAGSGNH